MDGKANHLKFIREWVLDRQSKSAAHLGVPPRLGTSAPVAITGVAGFFPDCMDVESFFDRIDRDESMLGHWSKDRKQTALCDASRPVSEEIGGFIPDIASFDPALFGILPLEAEEMDPRQRLLLLSTWRTLEDAGISPGTLKRSATGVFVACEANEYAQLMTRCGVAPSFGMSQADSMIANRVSYHFDFSGPSEMVNATCAGFAVALQKAFTAIQFGLIDRAIVGAANVILLPEAYRVLRESGQLASGASVHSFGDGADGFIRSEAAGTILLERLDLAEREGKRIYALIRNAAVNFNGRGGLSMSFPNVAAHAELVESCYRGAGIDPRRVTYIEAQGMGLPVADIAEWTALNRALATLCQEQGNAFDPGFCRVSTLKPLAGHMHAASSLAGLLRVIRSFHTGTIHKIADFTKANAFCDANGTPCRLATETEAWPATGSPRLAGVHAFGSGGNNAHILLEEYVSNRVDREPAARHAFQLQRYWFHPAEDSKEQRRGEEKHVLAAILESLGQAGNATASDAPFSSLGVDSLGVAGLIARLASMFRVDLRKPDLFSHSTPKRLAAHIVSLQAKTPPAAPQLKQETPASHVEDEIAIVGMSLRLAGAGTPGEFWSLLERGKSSIDDLAQSRSAGHAGIRGGFLPSIDRFDPLFFGITPREAERMDPRHRMLLEQAWSAIEDSGHNPEEWRGQPHGIFLGIEESDYPVDARSTITSVHGGTAPARIGYFLDTKGPVLAVSTACSSSMVAIHYACQSIWRGESECALAGGINLLSQPARSYEALKRMGNMLSPDATCHAFDHRANGMVFGEGVGLLVLKRLSQARSDGDAVYAVIRGSGVNYDGRTNGLTAPNGERQRELYEDVQRRAGVRSDQISYVVAHGTGTVLGDPVEYQALMDAFRDSPAGSCALTSPKTNVGHTQAASGVVNVIAAALAARHNAIPASINFDKPNPDIAFAHSPLYVNTALKTWDAPVRFVAASSFGHTGTNAHLLLRAVPESDAPATKDKPATPEVIVLSAKTEGSLRKAAERLLAHAGGELQDIAYTLQVGRSSMRWRLAFTATSLEELRSQLCAFLQEGSQSPQVHVAEAREEREDAPRLASEASTREQLESLAHAWCQGAAVDWDRSPSTQQPRRVHLPTYAFEEEAYWIERVQDEPGSSHEDVPGDADTAVLSDAKPTDVFWFTERWETAPLTRSKSTAGVAVCIGSAHLLHDALRTALASRLPAWDVLLVWQGSEPESLQNALAQLEKRPDVIVDLRGAGCPDAVENPSGLVSLVQAVASLASPPSRLLLVSPSAGETEQCFAQMRASCDRSLRAILPRTVVRSIAIDVSKTAESIVETLAARLVPEIETEDSANVLSVADRRLVPTLRRIEPASPTSSVLQMGGTYLITGGGGELGFLFAEHLVHRYRANVVLTGRSELSQVKKSRLLQWIKKGSGVMYVRADVTDRTSMLSLQTAITERFGRLHGILHAAGVETRGTILETTQSQFEQVIAPKVQGAIALDEVFRETSLDFVAYFGSAAAHFGDFGACSYAMANRFLIDFAKLRNERVRRGERHGRTLAIQWPVWAQGGMALGPQREQTELYLKLNGLRALESDEGLSIFEAMLTSSEDALLVMAGEERRVMQSVLGLSTGHASQGDDDRNTDAIRTEQKTSPQSLNRPQQEEVENLRRKVSGIASAITGIRPELLRSDANLGDLGFDSMTLAEFATALSARFGIDVAPTAFFAYPTLQKLCAYLWQELKDIPQKSQTLAAPAVDKLATNEPAPKGTHVRDDDPRIAIIGMSGRFPQARTIAEMWEMLKQGVDAIEEVPRERFDWHSTYGDPAADATKTNGKWGGFVPGVAEFDPLFFELSPKDAATIDPRQRLLLQEAWNALEDAGFGPRQLQQHRVGVFVGAEEGDYVFRSMQGAITANHNGILASRLAYFLDLHGPAMAINTACSSGLVALHQACLSLRAGECDVAIAGAVNLMTTSAGLVAMGQAGMLSPDGTSYVFDGRANGMVPGEAVVALVLKPLARAEADGDPIHAIVHASAVNYDGKTNGITAPGLLAQQNLLRQIYAQPGLDVKDVGYIVAHGTGTKLGDPVEVQALAEAFKDLGCERGSCALTSAKSNFGHTFAASGLLSAVSLVRALQEECIPPSLHCISENEHIRWSDSPFFVNKELRPWHFGDSDRRMGGVSAFGMSGTNAHLLLHAYRSMPETSSSSKSSRMIVLSAKTEDALLQRVRSIVDALSENTSDDWLDRACYTLMMGRHLFRHRMAVVAGTREELREALQKFLDGVEATGVFRGIRALESRTQAAIERHAEMLARETGSTTDKNLQRGNLLALADYFCQGYDPDWSLLYPGKAMHRVHLPGYSFDRQEFWVGKERDDRGTEKRRAAWIHPLLERNVSRFLEQRFVTQFSGEEPFLADHLVNGKATVPAVAMLEMIRAAAEHSDAAFSQSTFQLERIVWLRPLAVDDDPLEIEVRLDPYDDESIAFSLNRVEDEPDAWCASGVYRDGPEGPAPVLPLEDVRARTAGLRQSGKECYAALRDGGVSYGPCYQALQEISWNDDECCARYSLPPEADSEALALHPGILDAAFQATLPLQADTAGEAGPRVPFSLDSMTSFGSLPRTGWILVRRSSPTDGSETSSRFDIDIVREDGSVSIRFEGMTFRALSRSDERLVSRDLTGSEFFLRDHGGLLPGALTLEWAYSDAMQAGNDRILGLRQVVWTAPVFTADPVRVDTIVRRESGSLRFRTTCGTVLHAQGEIIVDSAEASGGNPAPRLDVAAIEHRCSREMPADEWEARLRTSLGPSFQSLRRLRYNGREALAELQMPDCVRGDAAQFRLHPSLLNGALQAAHLLMTTQHPGRSAPVPYSLDAVWVRNPMPEEVFVYVKSSDSEGDVQRCDISILDKSGKTCVSMEGYCARSEEGASEQLLYAVTSWKLADKSVIQSARQDGSERAPIVLVDVAQTALRNAIMQRWPDSRFIPLPSNAHLQADTAQATILEVLSSLRKLRERDTERFRKLIFAVPERHFTATHAAILAVLRSFQLENPSTAVRIALLPETAGSEARKRWIEWMANENGAAGVVELKFDGAGRCWKAVLEEVELAGPPTSVRIAADDVVWITGGQGGVGWQIAKHLLERRARVVLSGRGSSSVPAASDLEAMGLDPARVRYVPCDVANIFDVRRTVDSILENEGSLDGVIHCAGVTHDARLEKKEAEDALSVLRPKIAGVLALDEATSNVPLNFMIFCSSLTGTFGNAGQTDYAAANAFLDAFAKKRNEWIQQGTRSGRTVSIGWPLWAEGGMSMPKEQVELLHRNFGMTPMTTEKGLQALELCLQSGQDHILVLHGEPKRLRSALFASDTADAPPSETAEQAGPTPELAGDALLQELTRIVADQQGVPLERIEPAARLGEFGYDSLAFTELANRMNRRFGLDLMPTLFFEKSTLKLLSEFLRTRYADKIASAMSTAPTERERNSPPARKRLHAGPRHVPPVPARSRQSEPIAVVGMSGRFPGAGKVEAFWEAIEANRDLISEVPPDRWDWKAIYGDAGATAGRTKTNCAGFITDVDRFDAAFFGISPREAISMDPQLRLMLETVWCCIEDAGYAASVFAGRRVGVFIGVSTSDYKEAWLRRGATAGDGPALVSHFSLANRISYTFDLRGPSEPIDTACSSSLVAVHRAIESIRSGACEAALVGGVNLILDPAITVGASRAGMLSVDGRCKTFDASADGYGRGEGVAALLLKPLERALLDGDDVYCVLRGSAENHGGRATSPAAPNASAQQALLVEAYSEAGIDPRSVGYVEAHGTGTELGDAVEIDALKGAWEELYRRQGVAVARTHCALGSVKTNIGHLEAAAGMAGMIKTIMMMRHKKIPGNPHLVHPNPYLRLEGTPFTLAQTTTEWPATRGADGRSSLRRAGVSSFGIGGSNAHVILEEAPERTPMSDAALGPQVIVLSAKNDAGLHARARDLLRFLERAGIRRPSLKSVAWTLQLGRESMQERFGFVAASHEETMDALRGFLAGQPKLGQRQCVSPTEAKRAPLPQKNDGADAWLRAWLQGAPVDWSFLQDDLPPQRLHLPAYAFEGKRFWFDRRAEQEPLPGGSDAADGGRSKSSQHRLAGAQGNSDFVARVAEDLAALLAKALYLEPNQISLTESFADMGLDSVVGVEWIHAVNQQFGTRLSATTIYDHHDLSAFAQFLAPHVQAMETRGSKPRATQEDAEVSLDEILQRVQDGNLDPDEAEELIHTLQMATARGGQA